MAHVVPFSKPYIAPVSMVKATTDDIEIPPGWQLCTVQSSARFTPRGRCFPCITVRSLGVGRVRLEIDNKIRGKVVSETAQYETRGAAREGLISALTSLTL